jgi:prevent-host-death family protein
MAKTRSLGSSAIRAHFSEVRSRVLNAHERLIVTKNGRPVAAVVPLVDLDRLQRLDRMR